MFDIRITGGTVLDGTGTPGFNADVGITGDTITAVGDLSNAEARHTVDLSAAGSEPQAPTKPSRPAYVCPGFIDAHSHSDAYLLVEPDAQSKLYQGVTTEVVGNCGSSAAPVSGEYRLPSDWADKPFPGTWHTVAEYRSLIDRVRPAVNVVLLIGHNNLRAGVAGYKNRTVTDTELAAMTRLLDTCMDEGGRGLSTGLIYMPGLFAPEQELVELSRVAARRGGVYASHMRNEGPHLLEAIDEAVSIGRKSGVRVEIAHLKTHGKPNWHFVDEALQRIRSAREEGLPVAADRYPYVASSTDLDAIFPQWAKDGGREAMLERLRDTSERARIREDLLNSRDDDYWPTVLISATTHPDNLRFRGLRLPEVAAKLGMDPVDAALHLVEADNTETGAFFFGMNEENMARILAEHYVMIGSDAALRAPTGPLSESLPHPRAYGSFTHFLRLALDGKTVPLPEAVRKMTSLPASQFGLQDRGTIAEGRKADVLVFKPEDIRETASYTEPHHLSRGMQAVIVNGVMTLEKENLTGKRNGRFLE